MRGVCQPYRPASTLKWLVMEPVSVAHEVARRCLQLGRLGQVVLPRAWCSLLNVGSQRGLSLAALVLWSGGFHFAE